MKPHFWSVLCVTGLLLAGCGTSSGQKKAAPPETAKSSDDAAARRGRVRLITGLAKISPDGFSNRDVGNAIGPGVGKLIACYERALQKNADLQGKVTLSFSLHPNGSFSDVVVVGSEMKDGGVDACLIKTLSAFKTEVKPAVKTQVEVAVIFRPF
jgi:TonB family protein